MRGQLAEHAEAALDGELVPAQVALAACTLLNVDRRGDALDRAVELLGDSRMRPAQAGLRPVRGRPERVYCWGSEALTMGLAIEAIARASATS